MAPQEDGRRDGNDERGPPFWVPNNENESSPTDTLTITPSIVSVLDTSMAPPIPSTVVIPVGTSSDSYPTPTVIFPSIRPSQVPSDVPWPPWVYGSSSSATEIWQTSASVTAPYPDGWKTSSISVTPTHLATYKETEPSTTTRPYGGRPSNWDSSRKHANYKSMYAAAAIVPVVVLAIIGVVAFVCLRKRKRRQARTVAIQPAPQEMKMKQQPTVQPYMAPPPPAIAVSGEYNVSSSQLPPTSTAGHVPIILGPIGTGPNGAYLTGMDTSDMVSVNSNTFRPVDPFADNNSLTEPPPPYRPHSVAPPSFTSNSRQSSLRATAPPTTSQTHLMERSPFEDPDDDDNVSELSVPTVGRNNDAMSAVFDLSYQCDPVAGRPSF